jgi:hypothetical protein
LAKDVGHFSTYLQSICDSVESPWKWNPQAHFLDMWLLAMLRWPTTESLSRSHEGRKGYAALVCILLRCSHGDTVPHPSTLKVCWIKVWGSGAMCLTLVQGLVQGICHRPVWG